MTAGGVIVVVLFVIALVGIALAEIVNDGGF